MIYDIQKANMWKRISAYILDVILLGILAVGIAFFISVAVNYDAHTVAREQLREKYETQYGVDFDISQDDYNKLSETDKRSFDDAYAAFATDPEVNRKDVLIINLSLIIVVFGILGAFVVFEFLVPLKLKNGQTVGKKIFGIGVMRVDGVKISVFQLFVRTILGKYTLETMLPVLLILMFMFNVMPLACVVGIAIIAVLQIAFVLFSHLHTPIHDVISGTVTVDIASQLIFDTPEALLEYKKRLHAEMAEKAEYR